MKDYSQEGNFYNGQLCQKNKCRVYPVFEIRETLFDKFCVLPDKLYVPF